jgi:esterase FrsA
MGLSFGANFSAMTGLASAVDAAIVLGAPVDAAFVKERLAKLPYGMADIVGNAIGFNHRPTLDELTAAAAKLSRHALLQRPPNAPMLVINGADDYFVPQEDTLIFKGRPDTDVRLIPGTGHCAMSKLPEIMPIMIGWIRSRLGAT